jgi:hypothetical protein
MDEKSANINKSAPRGTIDFSAIVLSLGAVCGARRTSR